MKVAVDLYYAAHKYDIKDIAAISSKFLVKVCCPANSYYLYEKAMPFHFQCYRMSDLRFTCIDKFEEDPYGALVGVFEESPKDEILSKLLDSNYLAVVNEFDIYIALQIMVETKVMQEYSKCLSQIRFLTMDTRAILQCDLLTHEEKYAVIDNIEARKLNKDPMISMPPNLSGETELRE